MQGRRISRAAAIREASEAPRPGAHKESPAGEPSDLLSPLSHLPLSPLSSMGLDMSAEPLSPNTTAVLQILRTRGFSQIAGGPAFSLDGSAVYETGVTPGIFSSDHCGIVCILSRHHTLDI